MKTIIIHLSDLHYRKNWIEEQGIVLNELFKDLSQQIERLGITDIYLAFSGDIVQAGSDANLYNEFFIHFDDKLNNLNIPKSRRICVPGNHDVSIKQIEAKDVEHEGIVSQDLNETQFNNYILQQPNILTEKFTEYDKFAPKFADILASESKITGAGWNISDDIGIYCLNTALCSSGGLKKHNNKLIDKKRLAIDTRSLHEWNLSCKARWKILVMHHPLEWLTIWAMKELITILHNDFVLCLSGHAHDQSIYHSINKSGSHVKCSAPPLFTQKSELLGYSLITICSELGVTDITYRQWTQHHTFVTGVNFSNSDNGTVNITAPKENIETKNLGKKIDVIKLVDQHFTKRLDDALVSFTSQPKIWIEPILSNYAETERDKDKEIKTKLSDLISRPRSIVIKAPPQFGLTCLAYYLAREAWRNPKQDLWLYLNAKDLNANFLSIKKSVESGLELFGFDIQDVKCVILDSWTCLEKTSSTLLQNVLNIFCDVPVIVMQTIVDTRFLTESNQDILDRKFETLYLWTLPRSHIRKIVTEYNKIKHIGDDDSIISRVVFDLKVLNLHRTPLNCLTLLKVSEIDFNESPVNRTELIGRVLFLLFNIDVIPTYKVRPDLKDCEYVLGFFCESMLRKDEFAFTKKYFLSKLQECCDERIIDLDVNIVFDVLHNNNILINHGGLISFRFIHWIFYFAAQRMHHDKNFARFVLEKVQYANYPEIIEFYTGIDRRREDALRILIKDVQVSCDKVHEKCGLPDGLNPYRLAQWKPSTEILKQIQNEITDSVQKSNFPNSVKDVYSDNLYDQSRPYYQEINNILNDSSFLTLLRVVTAASRALRNSDYVNPDIKRQLLREILRSWEQMSKVCLVLSPLVALNEKILYDGVTLSLYGHSHRTPAERLQYIISCIPDTIVTKFSEDLFSQKMGPLLIAQFAEEKSELRKHELVLLLIHQRPREWKTQVQKYIESNDKNSFYLWDVYLDLCFQYSYSYTSHSTLRDIKYLIKMVAIKHKTGSKKPGRKAIEKISDKILPKREIECDDEDIL